MVGDFIFNVIRVIAIIAVFIVIHNIAAYTGIIDTCFMKELLEII